MMKKTIEPILRIPETVKKDVQDYRGNLEKFLKNQTSPIAFKAYRVPMSIYEQRTVGRNMVRAERNNSLRLIFENYLEGIKQWI